MSPRTRRGTASDQDLPAASGVLDADGIVLQSGERLDADIIVTATGLELLALGGVTPVVDNILVAGEAAGLVSHADTADVGLAVDDPVHHIFGA